MAVINYRDARPIYEQIADHYKQLILSGVMQEDEQMPSVRALAVELATNPNTIQKAYAELTREGFMYTVKGKGNFVAGNPNLMDRKKDELKNRLSEIRKEGAQLGIDMDALWAQTREDN
ncbi:GntR family transcriptional regulator [Lachnospiraceae bacterium XBB2008]|nr:GntR family transcriptional regulator [Lachnospiraceae bacterium XBB2008]